MIENVKEASLLYDFYGQLLTKRKQEVMQLYHEEDYTLAEIADEFGISRAAVHDSLKSAEKSLLEYEEKLGLVAKFTKTDAAISRVDSMLADMTETYRDNQEIVERLKEIQGVIDGLGDM